MLEFSPFPLLAGLSILGLLLIFLSRRRSPAYLLFFAGFGLYLLVVVGQVVFPIPILAGLETRSPALDILVHINLVPMNFGQLFEANPTIIIQQILGNILLTLPFGFGIPFLTRVKPENISWLAVGVGLITETVQFGCSLLVGYAYRSVDINDVLLNAAGVLLGYALFKGFAWLVVLICKPIKSKADGLLAYVYKVAADSGGPLS